MQIKIKIANNFLSRKYMFETLLLYDIHCLKINSKNYKSTVKYYYYKSELHDLSWFTTVILNNIFIGYYFSIDLIIKFNFI